MNPLYSFIRKGLFALDAERAHELTIKTLSAVGKTPARHLLSLGQCRVQGQRVECMGLQFPNPIGLAAGADKNGEAIDGFGALGFGFIEVGTVTPLAQDGNPKPRQFRLPEVQGIINRNGFNNLGVDNLVENVKKSHFDGILGINIGKNTATSVENGKGDYIYCLNKVYPHADYIAINISSPNSPGLRNLQYGDALDDLLQGLKQRQGELARYHNRYVPIAVKIAPDLSEAELVQIADSLVRHQIDGVIATNTTISRDMVQGVAHSEQQGGLSGQPLCALSTQIIARLHQELGGKLPIIGCGGITSLATGQEKINAGASLLQLYSGMIYQGPALVRELVEHIELK
ncbi:quinone-dependent dihydroorotate dehydrogenase [Pasteurellaceae bacterium 20609_3]|uniref:quinone-dependent dihydroorotate dehydrogenase n=1 Tax=Spirabiliibacterium mucosae TaxID=28156 RepID=UPI001AACDF0B|nr:quinone-dependent dihydroorotate dehydrogenase [Spirabiliibacterium mucosae]